MYSGMIVAALLARWRHPHLRSAARMAQAGMESSPSGRAESTVMAYRFDHEFLQRFPHDKASTAPTVRSRAEFRLAPALERRPDTAVEPEAVDRRGACDRADAI